MAYLKKQMIKELFRKKIFLALMFLLTVLTSFMYFFVHFSIDANLKWLNKLPSLNEKQAAYQNGLMSNTSLASDMLLGFLALTGFVFAFVFVRFYREHQKQIGAFKALGFTGRDINSVFWKVTFVMSLTGGVIGLIGGFFASDILISANREAYLISGIRKGISGLSVCGGILVPGLVLTMITVVSWLVVGKQDAGTLMTGIRKSDYTKTLILADRISGMFPVKMQLPMRLALRNPVAAGLIIVSVMMVSVMFLLGFSLNQSSERLKESQLIGHNYNYQEEFDTVIHGEKEKLAIRYLKESVTLDNGRRKLDFSLVGMDEDVQVYEFLDEKGGMVAYPGEQEIVIGKQMEEVYGFHSGDEITVSGEKGSAVFRVSGVAFNATTGNAYVSLNAMQKLLGVSKDAYNGIYCVEEKAGKAGITRAERLDELQRDTVSNRVSAVIVQVMGCVIGCILLFLALLINFQSAADEMHILQLLGYQRKEIHRMLIDIYKPLIAGAFLLTLPLALGIVKALLRGMSRQIGDYMMFQTHVAVWGLIIVVIFVIYLLVQLCFQIGIRREMQKENNS